MNRTRKVVYSDLLYKNHKRLRKKKGMEVESNGHDWTFKRSIWMWYGKYFPRSNLYLNKIKPERKLKKNSRKEETGQEIG